jgi:hypothetical protein
MRRRLTWVATWLAALLASSGAQAAEVSLGAEVASARVWRGQTFNSTPVLEPFLRVDLLGRVPLVVSVHGTVDVGDEGGAFDAEGFSELQVEAGLDLPHGFKASYTELLYPGPRQPRGFPVTREVALGWLWLGALEGGIMAHYDVDRLDSVFVEAFLGQTFALSDQTRLTLEAEAGHAGEAFGVAAGSSRGGMHHYLLGARLVYQPTEHLRLTTRAGFAGTFDESLPRQPVGFHAAVGVSVIH